MGILDSRTAYLPMHYPWAFNAFKQQHEQHWTPADITTFPQDLDDYKHKLTDDERSLVIQILRFFTQTDIDVANAYTKVYMPRFKHPELLMAMTAFAAMEGMHIHAYSQVVDTLGLPDSEYSKFMDYAAMKDKHEALWEEPFIIQNDNNRFASNNLAGDPSKWDKFIPEDIVEAGREAGYRDEKITDLFNLSYGLAKFSGFAEGMQLFSSFAMLLNFKRYGLMKGMGQVVAWSIKDESLHVDTMIRVFRELMKDYPWLWQNSFKTLLKALAEQMVKLEDNFIDLAYDSGRKTEEYETRGPIGFPITIPSEPIDIELRGLTKDEIKEFVKITANQRLQQLGVDKVFNVPQTNEVVNWFNLMIAGEEHANFFEQRPSAYAKGTVNTDAIDFGD